MLLTWFKEWKDVEHMRILCCTQGSPEEIERMWIILKERERAFEACFEFSDMDAICNKLDCPTVKRTAVGALSI